MEKDKTIKIFLASSNELHDERVAFGNFIRRLDKIYKGRGMGVDVFEWEDYDAANNDQRKQDEYNVEVRKSDMFLAIFHKKAGKYTLEEYDVAMEAYSTKKHPKVYVYCKKLGFLERETPELKAFKARLSKEKKKYFWITYSTRDQLQLHFIQQLLMVENCLNKLKYEEGKVTLEGMHVADIDNLPFAKENKDYQRINAELLTLPGEIACARQFLDDHPNNDYMREKLQKKLDRYNDLKEEFDRLQKALFETSQRIAGMQREQLSDKLRRATELLEQGDLDEANKLLDKIISDPELDFNRLSEILAPYHQKIDASLLRAKTVMLEVNTPVSDRIKQAQAIYVKADKWAKDSALPDEKYKGLLNDYSSFLYDYGLYKAAEPVYLRLIALCEKLYGKEHPETADAYNGIGALYNSAGKYPQALEFNNKAMTIQNRILGLNHQNTATSYNNIGNSFYWQGKYAKALEYYKKALDIRKQVLDPDHPDIALSYNGIANVYHSQGDNAKALEYYNKALGIRERVLGPDHPSTARTYNDIGLVYKSQGDYPKALGYYEKALDIWERVLGPDHHSTAASYNNIGTVYKSQGDNAKALGYYEKALDIRERVLGPDHPSTAASYNNIGLVYDKQGDYTKALEYYEKALDIRERKLGPKHRDTKKTRNNMKKCYKKKQGRILGFR